MARMTKLAVAAVSGVAAAAASIGIAVANSGDDDETERPISGDALQKASDAALEHTGGGSVTGTEVGDEESLYEVEVTLEDGSQVDVQLDESFAVVGTEGDDDSTEDQD
ncbi:MAG: hypothetical protein ACRDVO_01335 [Jiangellaceae bacterium]